MTKKQKQYIWRIIAFDTLEKLKSDAISVKAQRILDIEGLQKEHYATYNKAMSECLPSVTIKVSVVVNDPVLKGDFDKAFLKLGKLATETWGQFLIRHPEVLDEKAEVKPDIPPRVNLFEEVETPKESMFGDINPQKDKPKISNSTTISELLKDEKYTP